MDTEKYENRVTEHCPRWKYISDRDRLIIVYKVNDIIDMNIVRNKNITYNVLGRYYHRDSEVYFKGYSAS